MAEATHKPLKADLFDIALQSLRDLGWKIERIPGNRKSSLRRMTKGADSYLATIRTSQDQYLAFPRDTWDDYWLTLNDADFVVVATVDNPDAPKDAVVHLIKADDVRERFDRAYDARIGAGYKIKVGRGLWLPLYQAEDLTKPNMVGAGLGLEHPPIAVEALPERTSRAGTDGPPADFEPLTIAEAKERLALTLGVHHSAIRITVEA